MKRILVLILAVSFAFTLFAGCSGNDGQINDGEVKVSYYNSASDVMPLLKTGKLDIALLPEPAATKLETVLAPEKMWHRIDIQTEYGENKYPQAVMMVKKSVADGLPEMIEGIENSFADNVLWIKNNVSDAVSAVNSHLVEGVTPSLDASLNSKAVDGCSIYWQSAENSVTGVNEYIQDIRNVNVSSADPVGQDFFYKKGQKTTFTRSEISVYAPDGAPALAIAKYIHDGETFSTGKTFNYNVVSSNDIGQVLIKGKGDIVIAPVNACTKLYKSNAGDPYVLVGVVTHGNLFIMSTENLSFYDLKDRTVGVIGQGLVPDLTFQAVLKKYNLKAVAL